MPQPALANPDHVGVRREDGGEEDPILESLWSSGSASETLTKPAAGKRQKFSDLNRPAKRRVGDLLQTAYSGSDEGKPDPDAAGVNLSLQCALSRVNPAFRENESKAAMFDEFAKQIKRKNLTKDEQAVKRVLVDQLVTGISSGLFSQRQVARATGVHRDTLRAASLRQRLTIGDSLAGSVFCAVSLTAFC
jgi:hypothetical protein